MFTASEKKRENIAEYLLYMWQIEDLIRANELNLEKIDENIINKYSNLDEGQKKQLHEWYESLIDMMRREGVAEKVKQAHQHEDEACFISAQSSNSSPTPSSWASPPASPSPSSQPR